MNNVICGQATSFSPFAIFVSPISLSGFYSPVSPVSGFVNTIKGGSTVPLQFNVFVNGIEKTDPSGLQFTVSAIGCTAGAAEEPIAYVTTGGTSLRYDAAANQFIQNWKTPKGAGCYLVRMTSIADQLSLSAIFKAK